MFEIILIWSLVAVVLHFAGVGKFAEWPVMAVPWKWSCMCIMIWFIIVLALLAVVGLGAAVGVPLLFGMLAAG